MTHHGGRIMDGRESGRLGGLATVERHGIVHLRTIGRAGFAAPARRSRSRRAAVARLGARGRMRPRSWAQADMGEADGHRWVDASVDAAADPEPLPS